MYDDEAFAREEDCIDLLEDVLRDERTWLAELASEGQTPEDVLGGLTRRDEDGGAGDVEVVRPPLRVRWLALLGGVLWDVFSDNHDVVGPDGRLYSLGSFRSSAGAIADVMNDRLDEASGRSAPAEDRVDTGYGTSWGRRGYGVFDYLDFYMGSLGADKARLGSLYTRVFERLRALGCSWQYSPPTLLLVRLAPPDDGRDDPASYDPGAAMAADAARRDTDAGHDALARDLAAGNAEAFERAERDPPPVVLAYTEVYGERPRYVRH